MTKQCVDILRQRYFNLIETPSSLPTVYGSDTTDINKDGQYAEFTANDDIEQTISMGLASNVIQATGQIVIDLYDSLGEGEKALREIAASIKDAFTNYETVTVDDQSITADAASPLILGEVDDKYSIQVSIQIVNIYTQTKAS